MGGKIPFSWHHVSMGRNIQCNKNQCFLSLLPIGGGGGGFNLTDELGEGAEKV